MTREKSFGIILNPVAMNATPPEEKKSEGTWQKVESSYNSQLRQLERARSLKIDQRTDKREYLVIEDNQEKLRLF